MSNSHIKRITNTDEVSISAPVATCMWLLVLWLSSNKIKHL